MLIDAETIRQAKEKLGDRTPNIIVNELAIEKWDERNLKVVAHFTTKRHQVLYMTKRQCYSIALGVTRP